MQYKKQIIIFMIILGVFFSSVFLSYGVTTPFYNSEKYSGQWPLGWYRDGNNTRSTGNIKGDIKNEIGIKNKYFTKGKAPNIYFGGEDINGDGKRDILWGYAGKLFLGDTVSGLVIWETKVLGINEILGIENIKGNGEKSIIVNLKSNPYILGVIDGKTGILEWQSGLTDGPSKNWYWGPDRGKYDFDNDGINEYYGQSWWGRFFAVKFTLSGSTVIGKTFVDTNYSNYNYANRINSPYSIGKVNGKYVLGMPHENNFGYYSFDTSNNIVSEKYKMPELGYIMVGTFPRSVGYTNFYDFDLDGKDETIGYARGYSSHSSRPRIQVGGFNGSGLIQSYWTQSSSDYNGFSNIIPLRDYSGSGNHALIFKATDNFYNNDGVSKYIAYYYKGNINSYKTSYSQNENYNQKVLFTYNSSTKGEIAGLFNNGSTDYVVLSKNSDYYFYKYIGLNTFNTGSNIVLSGSFVNFDKINKDANFKNNFYFAGYDINKNGIKEFVVSKDSKYYFYEIKDSGINEVRVLPNLSGDVKFIGFAEDGETLVGIVYNGDSSNTMDYYETEIKADGLSYEFKKKTDGNFYGAGLTTDFRISKLGSTNKVMFSFNGKMYDYTNTSPLTPPSILGDGYFDSYDVDGDGINEIDIGGKAYTWNGLGSYALKYEKFCTKGDFNKDGVLDCLDHYSVTSGRTAQQLYPISIAGCGGGGVSDTGKWTSTDLNGDGYDDFIVPGNCTTTLYVNGKDGNIIYSEGYSRYGFGSMYDVDGDGVDDWIKSGYSFWVKKTTGSYDTMFSGSIPASGPDSPNNPGSFGKNTSGKTLFGAKGLDGSFRIFQYSGGSGSIAFDGYYLYGKKYNSLADMDANGLSPIPISEILIGDFVGDGNVYVLVGGGDGFVYILKDNGDIYKTIEIGTPISKIIHGDIDNNGILDILVSAEDGYVYQLTNSDLSFPSWIKDGSNYGFDIKTQVLNDRSYLNFARNSKAVGYFIQLYNKTEKSALFDWVDIGNKTKACVISSNYVGALPLDCFRSTKTFSLNGKSQYVWRVMAYNSNVSSAIGESNGFGVLRVDMDKKVAIKENMAFGDENTVPPNTLLTYRVRVGNDSLNVIGGPGYMNYDVTPVTEVTNCAGVTDCRSKNLVISDYMPSTFTYIPNSTVFIVRSSNMGYSAVDNIATSVQKLDIIGNEIIISGGDQVSDSYFKNQVKTTLSSNPGATLIWEFPSSIYIPPQGVLEIQFDAIARK